MCVAVILEPMQMDRRLLVFLDKARELIGRLHAFYEEKKTGRPLYNPRGIAMIVLLKMKFKKDYQSLEFYIKARRSS